MIEVDQAILSLASLWRPEYLPPSAWIRHAPFAFWLTERLRPRRFVELGTHNGFSYFSICQAIVKLELGTSAFAIDIWQGDEQSGFYGEEVFMAVQSHNERYIAFSSLLRGLFEEKLSYFVDGSIDLLHIDGRHLYEDVKRDFEMWLPKLTDDATVLFHDTNVRERDFGVWRFIDEVRARYPTFEFLHGHGLGIVCPKGTVPDGLRCLMDQDADGSTRVNRTYAALGQSVADQHAKVHLRAALRTLAGKADDQPDYVATSSFPVGNDLARISGRLTTLRDENASFQFRLTESEAKAAAFESALQEVQAAHDVLVARCEKADAARLVLAEKVELLTSTAEIEASATQAVNRVHIREMNELKAGNDERRASEAKRLASLIADHDKFTAHSAARLSDVGHALVAANEQVRVHEARNAAVVAHVGAIIRAWSASPGIGLIRRASGQTDPRWKALIRDAEIVDGFLGKLEWFKVGAPHPQARLDRVLGHLALTDLPLIDLPLFDKDLYCQQADDLRDVPVAAILHYVTSGIAEKRDVHPLMSSFYYERNYLDAPALGMCPLEHFVKLGSDKGYKPHVLFETNWYKVRHPEIRAIGINPLAHYLAHPENQPHPLFDSAYYLAQNPDVAATGLNPLVHFMLFGADEDRNPNLMFDVAFYKAENPDVAASGVNPLVHFVESGATEGRDPHPGFSMAYYAKAYPDVAEAGFNALAHYLEFGRFEGRHSHPAARPSSWQNAVLMVDAFYPRPNEDSGSMDQISFIKIFCQLGYKVYFASALEFSRDSGVETAAVQAGAHDVCFPSHSSIEDFIAREGATLAICFLSRVGVATQLIACARDHASQAKIIFNTVDLHFIREMRHAETVGDPILLRQAEDLRIRELDVVMSSDATIVVSRKEEEILHVEAPSAKVVMVPLIRDYGTIEIAPFGKRDGVAFIGGFRHQPNLDAVDYLLYKVWPMVVERNPDLNLYIIGSHMPAAFKEMQVRNVSFVGFVENLAFWLASLRMTVAPLRFGAGAKGKVVTSLFHGVPCVATPIAAEGMGLNSGEDVLIGTSPEELAEHIVNLHGSEQLWTHVSAVGCATMQRDYSLESGLLRVSTLLDSVQASRPNRREAEA